MQNLHIFYLFHSFFFSLLFLAKIIPLVVDVLIIYNRVVVPGQTVFFAVPFLCPANRMQFIKWLLSFALCFLHIPNKENSAKYDAFLYLIAL